MTDAAVTAIFWGSRWTNVAFVGDKIAGLDAFYVGLDDSSYARTNTEYTGPNTTRVGAGVRYDGHVVDGSDTGFSSGPAASAVLTEVCKMIPIPVADGYYPVYTDVRRGTAGYCAWHSYGTCSGVAVQFAFFFDLDSDSGCDPRDTSNTHSQGLAALANVSGHEYSEALTDPRGAGWYDLRGDENSDKCAWSWPDGAPLLVAFPKNNTRWKLQANWSNAAYTAGTGFVNRSGQPGCVFTSPP